MINFSRAFSPADWPLWLKITVGLFVAMLVPLVIGAFIIQSGFGAFSLDAAKANLAQIGENQLASVTENVTQANSLLSRLVVDSELTETFTTLVEAQGTTFQDARRASLAMQREIAQLGYFSALRLVNTQGSIVAQATADQILTRRGFDTDSPSFIAAQNAAQSNRDQTVSISSGKDGLLVEFSHSVRNENNEILGFVIGTVDVQSAILSYLDVGTTTNSYLVAPGQTAILINSKGVGPSSSQGQSVAVTRALAGQTATTTYLTGARQNNEMLGFYGAVPNPITVGQTMFALVTERPVAGIGNPTLEYLGGARLFVGAVGLVVVITLLILLANQLLIPPLVSLREAMQSVVDGDFTYHIEDVKRQDEIGQLGAAFVDMRTHVRGLLDDLESRIASRTRDISATQEVGRFAASQRDLQTLLDQVVDLIVEKFPDIYHAQIFLVDNDRENALLRASTGEPGKIMLARGHRLAVGGLSVIGQVTGQGEVVVARDTGTSQVHQRNELLPLTRAELAIPLKVGDVTIGALDVQSRIRDSFGTDESAILQTMADQVAVAIENARLYQESVRRLEEIERVNRGATLSTWQEYLWSQRERQLSSESGIQSGNDLSVIRQQAIKENRIIVGGITPNLTIPIAVPVQLRGQILGAVEWEIPANDLNENKLQLAQELANRLAISLDNARLFQESQRAAERERVVNNIAARLTPQTEIGDILQTAVREVGQALRAPQVSIRLHRANGHEQHHEN